MVKLVYNRLVNCQSHADTVYEFSSGLNIFRADKNSAGKSVFFKMIKAVGCPSYYHTEEKRKQLIKHGAEYASSLYMFSDNSAGMVRVYPKQIIYYYTDNVTNGFTAYAEPPEEFVNALSLITNSMNNFIANMLDMDQDLLFVRSDSKTNNDLVELLTYNEQLDRMQNLTTEKIKQYREHSKYLEDTIDRLEAKLMRFKHVDTYDLKQRIKTVEAGIEVYENLIEVSRELENTSGMLVDSSSYDLQITACDLYQSAQMAVECLGKEERYDEVAEYALDIYEVVKEAKTCAEGVRRSAGVEIFEMYEQFLDVLGLAHEIKHPNELDGALLALDVYEQVGQASFSAKMLYNSVQDLRKSEERLRKVQEEFNAMGRRVPCAIYGEVQHVEGECIPIELFERVSVGD